MQSQKKLIFENFKNNIITAIKDLNATNACFTGHRSQNLPWGFNENDNRCLKVKKILRTEIIEAIKHGYTTFFSGMAIGFDLICAETVIDLKKDFPNIKLIGVLPCRNQDYKWTEQNKTRYRKLLEKLDGIRCIYDEYIGKQCMIERNKFMVNNSSLMIALFDGKASGTKSTIEYAKSQELKIVIIEP